MGATSKQQSYTPPDAARQAARRALAWRREHGRGGTAIGVARARDLASGRNVSAETIARMRSFFARHGANRERHYPIREGGPTAWRIAWDLWGGDAARTWVQQLKYKAAPSFRVYKDASGSWRWVGVSSTAYRDRDGEIVSSEALRQAVALSDATGDRGPLRYWHVPGLDLGTCDFQAVAGPGDRWLIESGRIPDDRVARAVAKQASTQGMTIGFLHPEAEPDTDGVFHHIRIFERSFAPRERVSNYFTSFHVKEQAMLTKEKRAAARELLGDQLFDELLSGIETTDKAVQTAGVAFKDAAPVYEAADGTRGIIRDGQFVALKAVDAPVEAKAESDGGAAMVDESEAAEAEDTTLLDLSLEQAKALIREAVIEALSGAMGDMSAKMATFDEQMKAMGYERRKEADAAKGREEEIASIKAAMTGLETRLKELEGDVPAGVKSQAQRPTDREDNVIRVKDASANPFEAAAAWLWNNTPQA